MCGIAGVVGLRSHLLAETMVRALRHRGPDSSGVCVMPNAAMGAARLAIVDIARGSQPLFSESGDIAVCFNGEIYNHRELRRSLERRGHVFRTDSDGEVIVHLYETHGAGCVEHLHGMFAFALMDGTRLLLARDRLGIKPLHYAFLEERETFLFASEIKALLPCVPHIPSVDADALADAALFGHPIGAATYFEGIRSLLPGHTLTVALGPPARIGAPTRFHRARTEIGNLSIAEAQHELANRLSAAIASHQMGEVDPALTLSGGLDSSVLAMLCKEQRGATPLATYTVADADSHPDMQQAAFLAQSLGARHVPVVIDFRSYLAAIPGLIRSEETPSSLHGLPFYILCQSIGQRTKTCLHGEGADELFGGYRDYLDRQYRQMTFVRRLRRIRSGGISPSEEAVAVVEALANAASFDEYLQRLFDFNMADPLERHHLDPVDKCAMASSVEMRVPYLDDDVVDLVTALPLGYRVRADLGIRKYLLRRMCLERFGNSTADIVMREKLGVPSSGVHHLQRFIEICDEMLPDSYLSTHEMGRYFDTKYRLLLFDLFSEIFIAGRGEGDASGGVIEFLAMKAGRRRASVASAVEEKCA